MPIATKLGRVFTDNEEFPLVKSHDPLITWSCEVTWQIKDISPTIRSLAIKIGKVVTYYEGLPSRRSNNPLNIESREVT